MKSGSMTETPSPLVRHESDGVKRFRPQKGNKNRRRVAKMTTHEGVSTLEVGDEELANGASDADLERSSRVNFRVGDLADALSDHPGSPGIVAKNLVARYVAFVDDEIRKMRDADLFTEAELLVVMDALKGIPLEPVTVPLLPEAVRQAAVVRKRGCGVDGEALVAKVQALETSAGISLLDAVERFWHCQERYPDPRVRLIHVGLMMPVDDIPPSHGG